MAYSYLTSPAVQRVLKNRRALLRWGGVTEEWYSLFEIGPYTFAPYKVAYRGEISNRFAATVVSSTTIEGLGERLILPDQTVHFVPCQDEDSAMYLAAIFNSAPVSFFYQAFGYKHPSTFFVAQLRIPPFVSGLHRCVALSRLARQATNEARYRAPDPSLIEHLDYAAGEVLGLSSADVRLSRDSLVSPSSAHRRSMPSASELDRAQVAD